MQRIKMISKLYSKKQMFSFHAKVLYSKIISKIVILITPYLFLIFINQVSLNNGGDTIIYIVFGYIFLYIFETYFMWKSSIKLMGFSMKNQREARERLTTNFSKWKIRIYEKINPLEIKKTIVDDTEIIASILEKHIYDFYIAIFMQFLAFSVLCFINLKLSFVAISTYVISFFLVAIITRNMEKINIVLRDKESEIEDFEKNILDNWKDVKTNGIEEIVVNNFYIKQNEYYKLFSRQQNYEIMGRLMKAFKDFFMEQIVIYFYGGILIFQGELSLVLLLTFIEYYKIFLMNITIIQDSYLEFNGKIKPLIKRILEFGKFAVKQNSKECLIENYAIKLENVSYQYDSIEKELFNDLNLSIEFGDFLAIVGKSGSGKSSFVKLLLGVLEPNEGNVTISNINTSQMSDEAREKVISVVSQKSLLFNMSIKDNLTISNSSVDFIRLKEACKKVGMLEYIESLPNKFDTTILENGRNLSGGQCVRLSLVRIMLLDPKIIILDEVTAGLDAESEKIVMETILELNKEKTIILISHNESTVRYANRILKIENEKLNEIVS